MSSPDPQFILSLAADLVAAKDKLASLQEQWDSFFPPSSVAVSTEALTPDVEQERPRVPRSNTLTARIIAFLDADPLAHWETQEIAKALGESPEKVQRTINKLVFQKKIGRYSRGLYESIIQV